MANRQSEQNYRLPVPSEPATSDMTSDQFPATRNFLDVI
ncbi:hypothetical protein C900_04720 [Fulvivirga imtechensis AK7]|uniref:Uncharacterized protein n=1 Tax=Fulvivirga imtechensis AK7 TaxID=1237149 RepID=L8JNL7_9BACT|nr:hypothetical protein C900_04720 [Fulvivirga imtechensis AK7]